MPDSTCNLYVPILHISLKHLFFAHANVEQFNKCFIWVQPVFNVIKPHIVPCNSSLFTQVFSLLFFHESGRLSPTKNRALKSLKLSLSIIRAKQLISEQLVVMGRFTLHIRDKIIIFTIILSNAQWNYVQTNFNLFAMYTQRSLYSPKDDPTWCLTQNAGPKEIFWEMLRK
jgi:hypothetical protein